MEGRRDPDAAPSARCRPARAAAGSFAADVAGPGVAGPAGRDAADRPPRRDAADRHSRHRSCAGIGTSSAAGGRAGRAGAVPGARRCAAMSGRWCCGWPGRTSRGDTAASTASWPGSASPWRRPRYGRSSRTPGSTRRRAGTARAGPEFLRSQAQGILALDFFTADLLNGTKVYVLAVIEHGTRRDPGPRRHRAPGPVLGRAAGPEPAHGPGGCRDAGEVRPA